MSSNQDGDAQGAEKPACEAPAQTALATSSDVRRRKLSPENCRNFIRKQTAEAMPSIVKTFVEKAKAGSVPHFTSLAKVGGFDQHTAAAQTPTQKRRSLARQLLDEVEKYEAGNAAEKAAAAAGQIDNQNANRFPQEHS